MKVKVELELRKITGESLGEVAVQAGIVRALTDLEIAIPNGTRYSYYGITAITTEGDVAH